MCNETDARMWAEHHEQFSADCGRLMDKIATVFRKLVAIEYESPWQVVAQRARARRRPPAVPNCP